MDKVSTCTLNFQRQWMNIHNILKEQLKSLTQKYYDQSNCGTLVRTKATGRYSKPARPPK